MKPEDLVVPPPIPKILDYPGLMVVAFGVVFTLALLAVAGKFDPSGGALTISLLVVLAFIAVVSICLFFTIPGDQATAAVIGGLTAAFGAVISYWLNHKQEPPP